MIYDPIKDIFYTEKIFPNWVWNEDKAIFQPPIPYPNYSKLEGAEDPLRIKWNQENTRWEGLDQSNLYIWNNTNSTWNLLS